MQLTDEHEELRRTYRRVIEEEINPHVNEWEAAVTSWDHLKLPTRTG